MTIGEAEGSATRRRLAVEKVMLDEELKGRMAPGSLWFPPIELHWHSPSDSGAMLGDNAKAKLLCALDVRGLKDFGDTLTINLLECSLSCGSEQYPLSSFLG